jgi:hypothetical protein
VRSGQAWRGGTDDNATTLAEAELLPLLPMPPRGNAITLLLLPWRTAPGERLEGREGVVIGATSQLAWAAVPPDDTTAKAAASAAVGCTTAPCIHTPRSR